MASIGSRRYRTSPSISAAHPAKSRPAKARHYVANATKDRHPRESGDPCGIGPRFRGDDGVVCDASEPCGICYIVPESAPRQSPDRGRRRQSARTTPGCYRHLTGPVNTPADKTRLPLSRSRSSHTVLPNAAGPTIPSLLPSSQTHGTLAPAREAGAVCGLEMAPFPYMNSYFIEACDALISINRQMMTSAGRSRAPQSVSRDGAIGRG